MKCHKELTAVVVYREGKKHKVVTDIQIRIGPVVIATRTAAGRWSQADALTDFKRNPFLFTKNVDGWPIAQAMKLVA